MSDEQRELRRSEIAELLSEAACLHLELGKHASRDVVVSALCWRFPEETGGSSYEAGKIYDHAITLLDAMPKKR